MRRSFLPLCVLLGLLGMGCDEQERNPPPPGTSAGSAGGVGNGSGSSPSGDTGDDDDTGGGETGTVSVSGGDVSGGDTGGAAEADPAPNWRTTASSAEVVGWVVGTDGTLIRLADDLVETTVVSDGAWLRGVAAGQGLDGGAWIVGHPRGLAHADVDGRWRPSAIALDDAFEAIASDGRGRLVAAGSRWLAVSSDGGVIFEAVRAPTNFIAVALAEASDVALLIDREHAIWRYDLERHTLEPSERADDVELRAIALSSDATRAVAVGDEGAWLESDDGGRRWSAVDAGTTRALRAVDLSPTGDVAVAVGDAGVVVTWDAFGFRVQELHDDAVGLRDVAIAADGRGLAVGDAGHAWATDDAGLTWHSIDVPTERDLLGIAMAQPESVQPRVP